jgi:hypothetical protein
MGLYTTPFKALLPGSIIMITRRQSKTTVQFENFMYYHQKGNLIAYLPEFLTIDQYDDLKLNGSMSYDPEDVMNKAFTYSWDCPANIP